MSEQSTFVRFREAWEELQERMEERAFYNHE